MKQTCQIIFSLSLGYILFIIAAKIWIDVNGMEFRKDGYEMIFKMMITFGIPIAIMGSLAGIGLRKKEEWQITASRIVLTIFIAIGFLGISIFASFWDMCGYGGYQTLFVEKTGGTREIIVRSFGCGATDSSPSIPTTYILTHENFIFDSYAEVDTMEIDMSEWHKSK